MSERARVGILISGRGSNMASLVQAMQTGRIAAQPAVVISNKSDAKGLQRAAELGVPTEVVRMGRFTREEHEGQIIAVLHEHGVNWVCLAGYMRLLSPRMVTEFRERILNIHPRVRVDCGTRPNRP